MIDFITLFDSKYLAQGLSMVRSLLRTTPNARMWVVAADEGVTQVLAAVALPGVRVVPLSGVETDGLKAVRPSRSQVEYYWTLTPFLPSYVFANEPTSQVSVYVDADMYFMHSAQLILDEFLEDSAAAAMITPHDFLPEYDQGDASGEYCVQFMPFKRYGSERILSDWQAQCLEWCFRRVEPGRFGDQKYLDLWPERFGNEVRIQESVGLLGAPWNARARDARDIAAYHFHGLRRISRRYVALHPGYKVPDQIHSEAYAPYLKDLSDSLTLIGPTQERTGSLPRLPPTLVRRLLKDAWSSGGRPAGIARMPEVLGTSPAASSLKSRSGRDLSASRPAKRDPGRPRDTSD